jgi:hypothetical protein
MVNPSQLKDGSALGLRDHPQKDNRAVSPLHVGRNLEVGMQQDLVKMDGRLRVNRDDTD